MWKRAYRMEVVAGCLRKSVKLAKRHSTVGGRREGEEVERDGQRSGTKSRNSIPGAGGQG
jgi:hypothetical protein